MVSPLSNKPEQDKTIKQEKAEETHIDTNTFAHTGFP